MLRHGNKVRDELILETRNKFKQFLTKILFPSITFFVLIHLIISLTDPDNSLSYDSFPTAFILAIGSIISIKVLFYTRLERHEIKKLIGASLFIIISFVGEIIYVYQQFVLEISIPYPSIADILYLSSNLFLIYHLMTSLISLKEDKHIKLSYIILINFLISIIPIYITLNIIIDSGLSIVNDATFFVTDLLYYILDILMLAPSIFIVLNLNRNNPFIFHWLSITLGITFITLGDLGYTYSAQLSEEFIIKTHTIWNIFYGIAYILLIAGILWYGKIKQILYDKEVDRILKNAQIFYKLLNNDETITSYEIIRKSEFNEIIEGNIEIFKIVIELLQQAKRDINILFTKESFLTIDKTKVIFDFIHQITKKQNHPNVRILAPLSENIIINREVIINSQIQIQYFQRPINFDAIVFLIDNKVLFIIEIKLDVNDNYNFYNARYTNNPSNVLIYTNLFERIWLSEISNRVS